jgi:hypothetical protein
MYNKDGDEAFGLKIRNWGNLERRNLEKMYRTYERERLAELNVELRKIRNGLRKNFESGENARGRAQRVVEVGS